MGMKVNIGAGGTRFEGWIHIDVRAPKPGTYKPGEFMQVDLRNGMPFGDATVGAVFCEHVLEHFDLIAACALADEVARVLEPGGTWRIAVPDALYRPDPEEIGYPDHKSMWTVDLLKQVARRLGVHCRVYHAWLRDGDKIDKTVPDSNVLGAVTRLDSLVVDLVKMQ